jgi:hypothetical protein
MLLVEINELGRPLMHTLQDHMIGNDFFDIVFGLRKQVEDVDDATFNKF